MTVSELSGLSGISRQQINRLVKAGKLPFARKKPNRRLEIDDEPAAAWAASMPSKRERVARAMDALDQEIHFSSVDRRFVIGWNIPALAERWGVSKAALYKAIARIYENPAWVRSYIKKYLRKRDEPSDFWKELGF